MSPVLAQRHAAWMSYWPKPEQLMLAIGLDAVLPKAGAVICTDPSARLRARTMG